MRSIADDDGAGGRCEGSRRRTPTRAARKDFRPGDIFTLARRIETTTETEERGEKSVRPVPEEAIESYRSVAASRARWRPRAAGGRSAAPSGGFGRDATGRAIATHDLTRVAERERRRKRYDVARRKNHRGGISRDRRAELRCE